MSENTKQEKPLVVIVGPTASGKSALAISIAKEYGGEIISADSRAIYKGLSIGTAKPTLSERQGIPHWGVDIAEPGDRFTAADFQAYALRKIVEIRLRGKVPILVGGTGLYVDAVVYEFEFPEESNDTRRRDSLTELTIDQLHQHCEEYNIILPKNEKNKRHLVNAIMRNGLEPKMRVDLDGNTLIVGITTEKVILRKRIEDRSDLIFNQPVIDEALDTAKKCGWDNEAMKGNIYPLIHQLIDAKINLERAKELFIVLDWRLAKRQMTWLKRNKDIHWLTLDDAYTFVAHRLDKLNKS